MEFSHESQQRLKALLLDLMHKFVITVRELAERANKDRVERLRNAIRESEDDMNIRTSERNSS